MSAHSDASDRGPDLVFAICHEIGNLLAAVRLHAHLIDDEAGPVELAVTSVELDELCARGSALLAHVRPLLSQPAQQPRVVGANTQLANLLRVLADQGLRGVALETDFAESLPRPRIDPGILHQLLLALLHGALEAARPNGRVRLAARDAGGELQIAIEDDGPPDAALLDWRVQALRGRVLVCNAADHVLRKIGGRLEVTLEGGVTRVGVRLPGRAAAPGADPTPAPVSPG